MLPDKKLKNRFLLAAFASQLPALLWFINLEFVHNSFALDIVDIIFTAIGFFTGIYALIILYPELENMEPRLPENYLPDNINIRSVNKRVCAFLCVCH